MTSKIALVTGSTGGLGHAIATALAAAGHDVAVHGLEAPEVGARRAAELAQRYGRRVIYVQSDVGSAAGVRVLVERVKAELGPVHVLVNNAVVRHFAPVEAFPVEQWERALAVNVSAAFHAVRLLLPAMRDAGFGRIVNMSSVYGSRGAVNRIDYVTTKSAVLGFTRAVALETLGQGVTCNAVCPGSVRTEAIEMRVAELAAARGLDARAAEREFLVGKQPTGTFVAAEDVASLVVYLCSEAARDITGAVLPVDGGWMAS
jgi:3-hydroxybutyrate dehydrogenase